MRFRNSPKCCKATGVLSWRHREWLPLSLSTKQGVLRSSKVELPQGNAAHMPIGRGARPGLKYRYNAMSTLQSSSLPTHQSPSASLSLSAPRQTPRSNMSDYLPAAQQHQTVGEALARRASYHRIFTLPDSETRTRLLMIKVEDAVLPHGGDTFWVRNCSSLDLYAEDWVGGLTSDQVHDEAAAIAQIRGL
jgi:hypothetical protein